MTIEQIQQACLPCEQGQSLRARLEYTRHVLRLLYKHKYVMRREWIQSGFGRNPLIYGTTWKGAQAAAEHYQCDPADLGWNAHDKAITWTNENLHHLIMENQIHLIFSHACELSGIELREWKPDRVLLRELKGKKVKYAGPLEGAYEKVIIPDGYYILAKPISHNGRTGVELHRFFVEIDMGTQTLKQRQQTIKQPQRTWEHKVKAYLEFLKDNGVCQEMFGTNKVRVLLLTTSEQRMFDLKKVVEDAGGNAMFWLSTFDALTPHTALREPIFHVAGTGSTSRQLLGGS